MSSCARLVTSIVHPAGFTLALSIPLVVGFFIVPRQHLEKRAPRLVGRLLVVGPGNISTIQDAVDQAVDGDSILVESGDYPGFAIVNKDLRVVVDQGATVNVLGHVSVTRLDAGRVVVLSGLVIQWQNFDHPESGALTTYSDLGHLRLQECTIRGFQAQGFGYGECGVKLESSGDVCLASCTVQAGAQLWSDRNGPPGIAAVSSSVAVYDSTLLGGVGGYGDCGYAGQPGGTGGRGGAAYEQTATNPTFVFLSGSSLVGGMGGYGGYWTCDCSDSGSGGGDGGSGGPCVEQVGVSPNPISVGTLDLTLQPGQGAPGGQGSGGLCSGGGPDGAPGQDGVAFVVPAQQVQQLSGSSRKFLSPRVARANAAATLFCYGVPGDSYQVFLSPALEFTYLPNFTGVRLARIPSAQLIASGTVPANGLFAPMVMLPPLDGADCRPLYLQAYVRDPSGQRFICAQMTLLEVDPRF